MMSTETDSTDTLDPATRDLTAADVAWNIETLLDDDSVDDIIARADAVADEITEYRGRVGELELADFVTLQQQQAELGSLLSRAGHYVMLAFSENTADPARGAALQRVQEQSTAIATKTMFADLEWAAVSDEYADAMLANDELAFARHHLETLRANREHLLSEAEETILAEKSVTGQSAWVRLFDELTSAIEVRLPDQEQPVGLEQGLSMLSSPDRSVRSTAAAAVSMALEPGCALGPTSTTPFSLIARSTIGSARSTPGSPLATSATRRPTNRSRR
ncbi:MAG: hypothetical protein R2710_07160 [Acidimicrobiales bacterium]